MRTGKFLAATERVLLWVMPEEGQLPGRDPALVSAARVGIFPGEGCRCLLCWSRGVGRLPAACTGWSDTKDEGEVTAGWNPAQRHKEEPCAVRLSTSCSQGDHGFGHHRRTRPWDPNSSPRRLPMAGHWPERQLLLVPGPGVGRLPPERAAGSPSSVLRTDVWLQALNSAFRM